MVSTHVVWPPDVVSALHVPDDLVLLRLAARERDAAGLPRPDRGGRAVEVDVSVPVGGALDAAALQPALLDPVDQVLLVGVVAVVDDERLEAVGGLVLDLS